MRTYILDPETKQPHPAPTLEAFKYYQEHPEQRNMEVSTIEMQGQQVRISTVFLIIDHGYPFINSEPLLFETMIFGGVYDGQMWRYATYQEALKSHQRIVALLETEGDLYKLEQEKLN